MAYGERGVTARERPDDGDVIVVGGSVWSDDTWKDDHDVVVIDGVVDAVTPSRRGRAPDSGPYVAIDARDAFVIPGFVNTHSHLFQVLLKGVGDGRPLHEWLTIVGDAILHLTPEDAYSAAILGGLEALQSGTTTIVDHMYPHPDRDVYEALIRGLNEVGIRAIVGRGVADRADPSRRWGFIPELVEPLDSALDHVEKLVGSCRSPHSRVSIAFAPPNPRCLTPVAMKELRSASDAHAVPVSIHLCESRMDDMVCRQEAGVGAVEYLHRNDFLWERLLAVHCCYVDEEGRRTLKESGAGVSHNPVSNMRLGNAIAPVRELLDAGVPVGLGTDGAASNDTQNMMETIKLAAFAQRARLEDAAALGAREVFDLATFGGNDTLGLPAPVNGLIPGAPADLVVLRFDKTLSSVPVIDPLVSLVTAGSPSAVETVMVSGDVVLRDGRSTRVEQSSLASDARARARRLTSHL
jgi:cytosine/adenosine deaminase-related metal-dependent hydrolase